MDYNEYSITALVQQRHAEMVAEARRHAMARQHRRPRPDVRAAVGAALIRLGAWLLREHYVTP